MSKYIIKKFSNKRELQLATAERCFQQLSKVLNQQEKASFIIPGGTTPGPVFEHLSKTNLNWKNVLIAQSDERWLESKHEQSNQGLTEKTLLINNAKYANYIPMKNTETTAALGEQQCNNAYQKLPLPFSLTMLGMGLDGHFASLFPGSSNLQQAMSLNNKNTCVSIDARGCMVAGNFTERMSLTLNAILNSRLIILLVTGVDKLAVLENAGRDNNPMRTPVSALINQTSTPIEIYWCA